MTTVTSTTGTTTTEFDPESCPEDLVSWKGARVSKLMYYSDTGALIRINFYNDASDFDIINDIYLGFMGFPRKKCGDDFVSAFLDGRLSWKMFDFGNFYTPQYMYKRVDGQHSSMTLQFYRNTVQMWNINKL